MPTLAPSQTPYYGGGQVINPANVIPVSGVPSPAIKALPGTIAVDNAAGNAYICVSNVGNVSTWQLITGVDSALFGTTAAMTAGAIVVSATGVTAGSTIFLTHNTLGGTPGVLSYGNINPGVGFKIISSSATDTSTVNYWIIN